MKLNLLTVILLTSLISNADNTTIGGVDMGEVKNSDAFNQVKKMLGKWEGKLYQQSGVIVDTSSEFKLVSNGNTIVEKLVEDGVEMMTTYSDKDGELVIKHYCALGTEPMFTVASVDVNSIQLKSDPTPGYDPKVNNYVESIGWTFTGKDTIKVNASLNLDGEIQNQYSLISKVD